MIAVNHLECLSVIGYNQLTLANKPTGYLSRIFCLILRKYHSLEIYKFLLQILRDFFMWLKTTSLFRGFQNAMVMA